MNIVYKSFAIGITAAGMGCAGGSLPVDQLANTEASLRAAQEVGAQNDPQGQLHLELAKEEVAKAKKLAEDGDEDLGTLQLKRAKIDAELALALSRQSAAEQEYREANQNASASQSTTSNAQAER
jgi:hypothetical protein